MLIRTFFTECFGKTTDWTIFKLIKKKKKGTKKEGETETAYLEEGGSCFWSDELPGPESEQCISEWTCELSMSESPGLSPEEVAQAWGIRTARNLAPEICCKQMNKTIIQPHTYTHTHNYLRECYAYRHVKTPLLKTPFCRIWNGAVGPWTTKLQQEKTSREDRIFTLWSIFTGLLASLQSTHWLVFQDKQALNSILYRKFWATWRVLGGEMSCAQTPLHSPVSQFCADPERSRIGAGIGEVNWVV